MRTATMRGMTVQPKTPVKCKDCGYLGVRDLETWEIAESDPDYRTTGIMPDHAKPRFGEHPLPICFRFAYPLREEYEAVRDGGTGQNRTGAIAAVLTKDRPCEKY